MERFFDYQPECKKQPYAAKNASKTATEMPFLPLL